MDDKYHIGYFGIYPISREIDLNFKINCNPLCAAADLKFQDADKDQNLIFVSLEQTEKTHKTTIRMVYVEPSPGILFWLNS